MPKKAPKKAPVTNNPEGKGTATRSAEAAERNRVYSKGYHAVYDKHRDTNFEKMDEDNFFSFSL